MCVCVCERERERLASGGDEVDICSTCVLERYVLCMFYGTRSIEHILCSMEHVLRSMEHVLCSMEHVL